MSVGVVCGKYCQDRRDDSAAEYHEVECDSGPDALAIPPEKSPPPPSTSNARGLVLALAQLQRELDPLVAGILDGGRQTLFEALEAENASLRERVRELEVRCVASAFGEVAREDAKLSSATDAFSARFSSASDAAQSVSATPRVTLVLDPEPLVLEPEPKEEKQDSVSEPSSEGVGARVEAYLSSKSKAQATGAPKRAFVINVRRLVEVQETFSLLHDLIQSTAMAALTLCSAGSPEQLRSTCCFLVFVIVIFVLHGKLWDTLDVSDLGMMLPVISDDDHNDTLNPNRLLKVLTFAQSNMPHYSLYVLELTFAVFCVLGWLITERAWQIGHSISLDQDTTLDALCRYFVSEGVDTDAEVLGMQVAIMTLMFVLHLLFKAGYNNETCAVMPSTPSGEFWDPRKHGLPWRYWLLGGLPSMWFTSEEVLRDLMHYIYKANETSRVVRISPQEIALYALSGVDELESTKRTLQEAMLFDGRERQIVGEKLNIDLCFFDSKLHTRGFAHPGEFLSLMDEDGTEMADLRTSTGSKRSKPPRLTAASLKTSV